MFLSEHKISVFNAIFLLVLCFLPTNNIHLVEIWMSWQHASCNEEVIKVSASTLVFLILLLAFMRLVLFFNQILKLIF